MATSNRIIFRMNNLVAERSWNMAKCRNDKSNAFKSRLLAHPFFVSSKTVSNARTTQLWHDVNEFNFFSWKFQRRTSREGLLNTVETDFEEQQLQGEGSSDPLLQIPSELSAVLTLKRAIPSPLTAGKTQLTGSPSTASRASSENNQTPLLKRKRESIV